MIEDLDSTLPPTKRVRSSNGTRSLLCSKCGKERDGGHKSYCKACMAAYVKKNRNGNREAYNIYQSAYQKAHPEYQAEWQYKAKLKANFGLTMEDVERMFQEQDGKCAICFREIILRNKNKFNSAAVDHDHTTGEVRGLLCGHCNKALGLVGDSVDVLRRAIWYLSRKDMKVEEN
jgi:Recombination endonuclease VII